MVDKARLRGDWFTLLEARHEEHTFTDAHGRVMRESVTQESDHVSQILHRSVAQRWDEGGQDRSKVTRLSLRYTFPPELLAILHYSGFTVLRQFGDWEGGPLTADSTSIIVVCRKRE